MPEVVVDRRRAAEKSLVLSVVWSRERGQPHAPQAPPLINAGFLPDTLTHLPLPPRRGFRYASGMSVGNITVMLQRIEEGDPQAGEKLLPLVYDELRRLAASKLSRETRDQTLQPTALVHEVWLRLGGDQQPNWANRVHFFAAAAEAMRRILIDNARRKQAIRHGGALARVSANATGFDLAAPVVDDEELLLVNEALDAFTAHDARRAELVKLKYFAGLTLEEAADVLGVSSRTAKRDWAYARAWLFNEVTRLRG